jgi:hypothetical protein
MYRILERVRKTLECYARNEGYDSDTLIQLCAIASVFVTHKLAKSVVKAGIYGPIYGGRQLDEPNHCWVETDTLLIDITIKQFDKDLPKVFVKKLSSKFIRDNFKHAKTMVKLQDFHAWPVRQRPTQEVINKLDQIYKKIIL